MLGQFATERRKAIKAYRQFAMAGKGLTSPMADVRHQVLLGDDVFVEGYNSVLGAEQLRKVSKAHRRSVAMPLAKYQTRFPDRDGAMARAHWSGAYTIAMTAKHVDVHSMTVSRSVRKSESDQCATLGS